MGRRSGFAEPTPSKPNDGWALCIEEPGTDGSHFVISILRSPQFNFPTVLGRARWKGKASGPWKNMKKVRWTWSSTPWTHPTSFGTTRSQNPSIKKRGNGLWPTRTSFVPCVWFPAFVRLQLDMDRRINIVNQRFEVGCCHRNLSSSLPCEELMLQARNGGCVRSWKTCLMFCKTSSMRDRSTGPLFFFQFIDHHFFVTKNRCKQKYPVAGCYWLLVVQWPGSPGSSFGCAPWRRSSRPSNSSGWQGCPLPWIWSLDMSWHVLTVASGEITKDH